MALNSSIHNSILPIDSHPYQRGSDNDSSAYYFSIKRNIDTSEELKSILNLPYSLFIENNRRETKKQLFQNSFADSQPDMLLSITTSSCYTSNVAHAITYSIQNRFEVGVDRSVEIATCLHEAIMNSMLHGNLEMDSDFRTLKGLYAYQSEIEKRLSMFKYSSRRIGIMIWNKNDYIEIIVRDEGKGFSIPKYTPSDNFPNGRGLMFISSLADSVWVEKDDRALHMTFNN